MKQSTERKKDELLLEAWNFLNDSKEEALARGESPRQLRGLSVILARIQKALKGAL